MPNICTPMAFAWNKRKKIVSDIFQWMSVVMRQKIDIDFFDFLGIFCREVLHNIYTWHV